MRPMISIIIPIYNTNVNDLKRCVKSIIDSITVSYEVLLIDDGSEKYIEEICLRLKEEYKNIRFIKKKNGGVSSARNVGIREAEGDYIMFVDADDVVSLKDSSLYFCEDGMTVYDMLCIYNGKQSVWKTFQYKEVTEVTVEEILKTLVFSHNMNSSCGKIYSKSIIDAYDIKFDEAMVTGEDLCFVCEYLTHADFKVLYYPISIYSYYRDNSSRNARIKKYPDIMIENSERCYDVLNCIVKKANINSGLKKEFMTKLDSAEVESMFNYETDMICTYSLTKARKAKIKQIIVSKENLSKNVALKSRIKSFLIRYDCWIVIVILAWIRALYLKIK